MQGSAARSCPSVSATRIAIGCAVLKLAIHLATLSSYGWFRDELYYVACADHLAWGYVDHPPLSIAVLALWRAVVGDGLAALHVLPAIIGAAVVLLVGRLTIALGGGRLAVALGCVAMLSAPARLATDHDLSMNGLDALCWVAAALLVVRAHASGLARDWTALGVVLGLGLENKWSMLWFGAGLAVAIVATPWRGSLRRSGPYLSAAIALALFAPNVIWQVRYDWPTLEFMRNALAHKYVRPPPGEFARELVLLLNPAAAPLWLVGMVAGFTRRAPAHGRPLAIVFAVTVAIVAGTRGKPEYLVAASAIPIAIGAVAWERALARVGLVGRRLSVATLVGAQLGLAGMALPFAIPVLRVDRFIAYAERLGATPSSSEKKELGSLPQHYADMHGWPELVAETARAWNGLTPAEREHAVIWATSGGYGSAAAIDVLGRDAGLPRAISTHNNYWLWGWHDADGSVVVLLGGPRDRLAELFETLEQTGTVRCAPCMPYEDNKPIYVGRGMKRPFSEIWPRARHYE